MSFLGFGGGQRNDRVMDTTKSIATGGAPEGYTGEYPVPSVKPPSPTDPLVEAAAEIERRRVGRGTFLSLFGDTSGKSVSRRTLLGS